jgi:hypothetical protein
MRQNIFQKRYRTTMHFYCSARASYLNGARGVFLSEKFTVGQLVCDGHAPQRWST